MVSLHEDQAAGLRRLFARRHARILLVTGARGGAEQADAAVSLARVLAAAHQRVAMIDEQPAPHNAVAALGLAARFDLLQAINGDARPAQVALHAADGVRVLPAARLAREAHSLDARQRRALGEMLRGVQKGADFVVVNACATRALTPLALAAEWGVIAVAPGSSAATEAYRLMKQCRREAQVMRVALLPMGDGGSMVACRNLEDVAAQHLGMRIEVLAQGVDGIGAAVRGLLGQQRPQAPAVPRGMKWDGAMALDTVI